VAAGGVLGLLRAFVATRLAAGMLVGVSPTDPVAFGSTSALLCLVALAAILLPARRASELDPIVVLRYD
jgi:ABC-type antimicrobial peptide transport system permease subunit